MTKKKSTVEDIRQQFDADVERFSNLERVNRQRLIHRWRCR